MPPWHDRRAVSALCAVGIAGWHKHNSLGRTSACAVTRLCLRRSQCVRACVRACVPAAQKSALNWGRAEAGEVETADCRTVRQCGAAAVRSCRMGLACVRRPPMGYSPDSFSATGDAAQRGSACGSQRGPSFRAASSIGPRGTAAETASRGTQATQCGPTYQLSAQLTCTTTERSLRCAVSDRSLETK